MTVSSAPLWLVRHARPLVPPGVCYGATDMAADAQHTQACAEQLAQQLPTGLVLVSSPLRRCVQLADALCTLRPDLQLQDTDARLAEMDFGYWEGHAWKSIPRAAIDAWTENFADHAFGGAESVQQLMDRVGAAWDEHQRAARPVLWVTHAGVMRAAALLSQEVRRVQNAAQWPRETLDFGQLLCLTA